MQKDEIVDLIYVSFYLSFSTEGFICLFSLSVFHFELEKRLYSQTVFFALNVLWQCRSTTSSDNARLLKRDLQTGGRRTEG